MSAYISSLIAFAYLIMRFDESIRCERRSSLTLYFVVIYVRELCVVLMGLSNGGRADDGWQFDG